jgi:hypothetical protein
VFLFKGLWRMNILLVVPFSADLPLLASEAETLVNVLQPRCVLQDNVTEERLRSTIQAEVNADGVFDGIWIASHFSERDLQLTDTRLGRDYLVQYIALSGAHWAVLNGCESEGMAGAIAAIGVEVVAVAMTDGGVGIADRDAMRLAYVLAYAIEQQDGDLSAAFASIPNASRQYRYFPAGAAVTRAYNDDRKLGEALARLEEKVDNLARKVEGLTGRVDGMTTALERRPTAGQVMSAVAFGCILVLMVIIILIQRGIL